MEFPCLSTAAILRCETHSLVHNILLVIPAALEAIFVTLLVFTNNGRGFRHLWLTAEGWLYFILVLLEMLSQILPSVRNNLHTFKVFDRLLAATSSLPILFYSLFVFLLARAELINNLPHRLQTPTQLFLVFCIPAIILLNEISSFIGLFYQIDARQGGSFVTVGFNNSNDRFLWVFFMGFTLALYTIYQVLNTLLAFYRLVWALANQRRIETTFSKEIHLLKGTAWIACALTFGVIETMIGFAGEGFGAAMTRRVVRFFARVFIVFGVARGIDSVEDFESVHQETPRKPGEPSLRSVIDPHQRSITFRQSTPFATDILTAQRESPHSHRTDPQLHVDIGHLVPEKDTQVASDRVTVDYRNGTPFLNLRLSDLIVPLAAFTGKEHVTPSQRSSVSSLVTYPPPGTHPYPPRKRPPLSPLSWKSDVSDDLVDFRRSTLSSPLKMSPAGDESVGSLFSSNTIQEIVSQFPPLPPNAYAAAITPGRFSTDRYSGEPDNQSSPGDGQPRHSYRLPPIPEQSPSKLSIPSSVVHGNDFSQPPVAKADLEFAPGTTQDASRSVHLDQPVKNQDVDESSAPTLPDFQTFISASRGPPEVSHSTEGVVSTRSGTDGLSVQRSRWKPLTEYRKRIRSRPGVLSPQQQPPLTRRRAISIGHVQKKYTPTPTRKGQTRDSVSVVILPMNVGDVEMLQESLPSYRGRDSSKDSDTI